MATKNSGQFQKGQPSPNPEGRGAPFARATIESTKAAIARAAGSTGVIAYGGHVASGETSSTLIGRQKWVTYANARIRSAPVAISHLLRHALFSGVKWSLVENEKGGKAARKGLEVVQRGLLEARLPTPWQSVVSKALNGRYFEGFSLHATQIARRPDGLVTYTDIDERPQHTIAEWRRKSPRDPFTEVLQRIDSGESYPIPLKDCLYLRNDFLGAHPEGTGVLRLLVERQRQTQNYRTLEGSELFSGMGGTPIARVPGGEILHGAPSGLSDTERNAYVASKTSNIESIVADRIKTPEKRQYVVLDSGTYQGTDPNTISGIKKWDIEIVKAELAGLLEIRRAITDNDTDDARILGVEFVYMTTTGTYGAVESKVAMFSAQLSADLDVFAVAGTQQLARPLVAANGLDPDDACPTLVAAPISTEDVEKTCRALGLLNMAALPPNHPAKRTIFERLNLPWFEEDGLADLMAPRGRSSVKPGTEEDDVDDLDPDKPREAGERKP
jgi:hypothetical protein